MFIRKLLDYEGEIWELHASSPSVFTKTETVTIDEQERRVLRSRLSSFYGGLSCQLKSVYLPGEGTEDVPLGMMGSISFEGPEEYYRLPSIRGHFPRQNLGIARELFFQRLPVKLPDMEKLEYTDMELTWRMICYGPENMQRRRAVLKHSFRVWHVEEAGAEDEE